MFGYVCSQCVCVCGVCVCWELVSRVGVGCVLQCPCARVPVTDHMQFCVQLWAFGLLFRSVADWRGPLTAAIASGLCFGVLASLLFLEAPDVMTLTSLLYFVVWGVFYGVIRLRTGSLTGMSLVQALQSFTVWVVLAPDLASPVNQFGSLYLVTAVIFLVLIWRLWPKEVGDYRV